MDGLLCFIEIIPICDLSSRGEYRVTEACAAAVHPFVAYMFRHEVCLPIPGARAPQPQGFLNSQNPLNMDSNGRSGPQNPRNLLKSHQTISRLVNVFGASQAHSRARSHGLCKHEVFRISGPVLCAVPSSIFKQLM